MPLRKKNKVSARRLRHVRSQANAFTVWWTTWLRSFGSSEPGRLGRDHHRSHRQTKPHNYHPPQLSEGRCLAETNTALSQIFSSMKSGVER